MGIREGMAIRRQLAFRSDRLYINNSVCVRYSVGAWRSQVAHLTGGQEVTGSNPVAPTIKREVHASFVFAVHLASHHRPDIIPPRHSGAVALLAQHRQPYMPFYIYRRK